MQRTRLCMHRLDRVMSYSDIHDRLMVGCRVHYVNDHAIHQLGFVTAINHFGETPEVALTVLGPNGFTFWGRVDYVVFYEFGKGTPVGNSAHSWHYLDQHEGFVD